MYTRSRLYSVRAPSRTFCDVIVLFHWNPTETHCRMQRPVDRVVYIHRYFPSAACTDVSRDISSALRWWHVFSTISNGSSRSSWAVGFHLVITCTNKTKHIIKLTHLYSFRARSSGAGLFPLSSCPESQPRKEISYRVLTPRTIAKVHVEFLQC